MQMQASLQKFPLFQERAFDLFRKIANLKEKANGANALQRVL